MRDFYDSQPYVMHLQAEHRRLHKMLTDARKVILHGQELSQPHLTEEVLPTLCRIRAELAHHFAQEEQGGCLEEALSHCPSLSAEVRRIEGEHPRLLARLDRLIAQAQDCRANIADRLALEDKFLDLCSDLHAHEAAENELLTRGLGTNANGSDSAPPADALRD